MKNIFWSSVAILAMFTIPSCYDDEGNLISNKLGEEIYGTWFAQYDANDRPLEDVRILRTYLK